ncbi:hypothetical protein [Candidatus Magnetaquiglobus chichijimensis]|uniref:hypothetical protein n=1 Tax=Candidatus Magnetaquiglobus chichijimensis TaxID=3141448 RepID=UPI003B9757FF
MRLIFVLPEILGESLSKVFLSRQKSKGFAWSATPVTETTVPVLTRLCAFLLRGSDSDH